MDLNIIYECTVHFYSFNLKNINDLSVRTQFSKLLNIIKDYSFFYISDICDIIKCKTLFQNITNSNCILIDHYVEVEQNGSFFIIGFQKTIIIVKQQLLYLFNPFFSSSKSLPIYFLPNAEKDIFNQYIENHNNQFQCDENLLDEINSFNNSFKILHKAGLRIIQMKKSILSCFSGYLIQESYLKLNVKHSKNSQQNEKQSEEKNESGKQNENDVEKMKVKSMNDFIFLRTISISNFSRIDLVYEIENGELYAHKMPINEDGSKLVMREYNNYLQINYHLLPKFHCKIKCDNSLIIQFINGKKLTEIEKFHFTFEEKNLIILQIMLSINYLHEQKFIYRDLKPDNIMIDKNKTIFLIDFDRMIRIVDNENDQEHTKDFFHICAAPEMNENKFTDKNDIYSIGQMIYYIMCETFKSDKKQNNHNIELFKNNKYLYSIYKRCVNDIIDQRPSISDLIFEFYALNNQHISKSISDLLIYNFPEIKNIHNFLFTKLKLDTVNARAMHYLSILANYKFVYSQFALGCIYEDGKVVKQDINKAIYYYSLAADQNHFFSQFNLGVIYFIGKYVQRDFKKAIHYFTLAADQNCKEAQYNLGLIDYNELCKEKGINKAIYYYSLSANQNNMYALFNLGSLYFDGKYVTRNINKALQYYELASNQNHPMAQYNLGVFYFFGQYVTQNIPKAIHYLSLSSEKNYVLSQLFLGIVYYLKRKNIQDIKKAIHYLLLAANQNNRDAQYAIGFIYAIGDDEIRDVDKAIYYLSLAADKDDLNAQFAIGLINFNDILIRKGINYAMHYFLLAANQNNLDAINSLGCIYYEGKLVIQDIKKAIYYFELAAKHNFRLSQFHLAIIYEEGKYVTRDIKKAIYYYSLAAKQNMADAQYNLGLIYLKGKYITRDIRKAIHFISIAANQNHSLSLYSLGIIHYNGEIMAQDINKAIYYFSKSAKLNNAKAQYFLGEIFLYYKFSKKDKITGIDYLIQSSFNKEQKAHFLVGYFYHEGKYIQQDCEKLIKYYKEGSTFNNQFAKNNLGIIYKNGLSGKIQKNVGLAISYFEEAIRMKEDMLSMYNLAHIYIYEDNTLNRINESIKLLIKLSNQNFNPANILLCIALIKKHEYNLRNVKKELNETKLHLDLYKMILNQELFIKKIDFLYNDMFQPILSSSLISKTVIHVKNESNKNISSDFYNGFAVDINEEKILVDEIF